VRYADGDAVPNRPAPLRNVPGRGQLSATQRKWLPEYLNDVSRLAAQWVSTDLVDFIRVIRRRLELPTHRQAFVERAA
jgi:hypothetical protein